MCILILLWYVGLSSVSGVEGICWCFLVHTIIILIAANVMLVQFIYDGYSVSCYLVHGTLASIT